MLQIRIPGEEFWNEKTEEFASGPETVISLEHSLISISKWEAIWKKPYLDETYDKTILISSFEISPSLSKS